MKENRIPHSTIYFCGNCEDEVTGSPAGARIPDCRPLCERCTLLGIDEGWAMADPAKREEKRFYEAGVRPQAFLLVAFIVITALIVGAVMLLISPPRRG